MDSDSSSSPQVQRSRGNATQPGGPERGSRYYREQKPSDPSSSVSDTPLTPTKNRWLDKAVCIVDGGTTERVHPLSPLVTVNRLEPETVAVPEDAPSMLADEISVSPSDQPGQTPEKSQPTPETELESKTRRSMEML